MLLLQWWHHAPARQLALCCTNKQHILKHDIYVCKLVPLRQATSGNLLHRPGLMKALKVSHSLQPCVLCMPLAYQAKAQCYIQSVAAFDVIKDN